MLLIGLAAGSEALARGFLATAAVTMRIPSAGSGGEGGPFGLPQVLVVVGAVVLILLLAGLVVWRVRRTRRR